MTEEQHRKAIEEVVEKMKRMRKVWEAAKEAGKEEKE